MNKYDYYYYSYYYNSYNYYCDFFYYDYYVFVSLKLILIYLNPSSPPAVRNHPSNNATCSSGTLRKMSALGNKANSRSLEMSPENSDIFKK